MIILGIDPGGTTGLCTLVQTSDGYHAHPRQLTSTGVHGLLAYIDTIAAETAGTYGELLLACEDFVVRGLATRTASTAPKLTRELIGAVRGLPYRSVFRVAGAVKPWATDKRLAAAFGQGTFTGMPHAADAARHALYAGVRDLGWPDPLKIAHK